MVQVIKDTGIGAERTITYFTKFVTETNVERDVCRPNNAQRRCPQKMEHRPLLPTKMSRVAVTARTRGINA